MPAYKNNGTAVVVLGSLRIEPGETKTSEIFFKGLPSGVVQTATAPTFDPQIYSEKITSTKSVSIPTTFNTDYRVKLFCTAGEVSIKYNDSNNAAILLGPGMSTEITCLDRIVETVIFTISSGTVYLNIEKI